MSKKINIFLCDDHLILLDGLKQIINSQQNLNVVGSSQNYEETKKTIQNNNLSIDILILDIKIYERSGIDLAKYILQNRPKIKIIYLTMFTDENTIKNALESGCLAYLPKNIDADELILAIKTVSKGLNYFPLSIIKSITSRTDFERDSLNEYQENETLKLSVREKQVLSLMIEGETSKQIGDSLFLSVHTVNTYKKSLFKKFEVNNVASLVVKALKYFY